VCVSGNGRLEMKNGSMMDGIWRNGRLNGFGNISFSNGDSYEGDFLSGFSRL